MAVGIHASPQAGEANWLRSSDLGGVGWAGLGWAGQGRQGRLGRLGRELGWWGGVWWAGGLCRDPACIDRRSTKRTPWPHSLHTPFPVQSVNGCSRKVHFQHPFLYSLTSISQTWLLPGTGLINLDVGS